MVASKFHLVLQSLMPPSCTPWHPGTHFCIALDLVTAFSSNCTEIPCLHGRRKNHMARSRLGGLMVMSLVLVLAIAQTARSDDSKPTTKPVASPQATPPETGFPPLSVPFSVAKDESVCRVYSLREMSQDPNFGWWVAKTIPEVIQPGSWSQAGGKNVLRYNAST